MSQQHNGPAPPGDEQLHRYHDGELAPEERATVEAALAREDPAVAGKLAALDELGGALRAAYGGAAIDAVDVWPSVARGIADAKVIPISQRVRRRAPVWISTLAVAAAVLAVLLFPWSGTGHASNGCDIEELEVTGANATIMKIPDDRHGGSTTVLWLEE